MKAPTVATNNNTRLASGVFRSKKINCGLRSFKNSVCIIGADPQNCQGDWRFTVAKGVMGGDQADCVTDPGARSKLDDAVSSRLHPLNSPLIPNRSIYLQRLALIPDRINNLGWISKTGFRHMSKYQMGVDH